jgi:hypothetical protein
MIKLKNTTKLQKKKKKKKILKTIILGEYPFQEIQSLGLIINRTTYSKYFTNDWKKKKIEKKERKKEKLKQDLIFIQNFLNENFFLWKQSPNRTVELNGKIENLKVFNFCFSYICKEFKNYVENKNLKKKTEENYISFSKSKFIKLLKTFKNYKFSSKQSDLCRKCVLFQNFKVPTEAQQQLFNFHKNNSIEMKKKYEDKKNNLTEEEIVINLDYKSNASLFCGGKEVSKDYYHHPQIAVFGVSVFYKNKESKEVENKKLKKKKKKN